MDDKYTIVLEKFEEFWKYGHLQLRFKFEHTGTALRLESAGYTLTSAHACGNLAFDIIAPKI